MTPLPFCRPRCNRRRKHGWHSSEVGREARAASAVKDDLSRLLREAGEEDIVITRHGKPAGLLIGFASEDDWLDYRLETDPRFRARIEKARRSLRAGRGVRLEDTGSE